MRRACPTRRKAVTATALALAAALAAGPAASQTPRRGGILNAMQAEDPPAGFSIHETATIHGLWPSMPCYSNLVLFDPFKARETADTVIPELAEKWSWRSSPRTSSAARRGTTRSTATPRWTG